MNVDSIMEKLLSVRGNKPGKQVDLKEDEIKFLIDKSSQIIKEQKMLVELEAPLHVCGDIHGQYYAFLEFLSTVDIQENIIIYFWEIMSIEENNLWKQYVYYFVIKLNIQRK